MARDRVVSKAYDVAPRKVARRTNAAHLHEDGSARETPERESRLKEHIGSRLSLELYLRRLVFVAKALAQSRLVIRRDEDDGGLCDPKSMVKYLTNIG